MKEESIIPSSLVKASWLSQQRSNPDLIILDATIPKVGQQNYLPIHEVEGIPGVRHFDLKGDFMDQNAKLPNTCPNPDQFQVSCQKLGINQHSQIIIYDRHGIYSSPRAWWLFKAMGKDNVAILDGGLPAWLKEKYPLSSFQKYKGPKGNFSAHFKPELFTSRIEILDRLSALDLKILDARSSGRFYGTEPEPRTDLLSGHIPGSTSLPHSTLKEGTQMKSKSDLQDIFKSIAGTEDQLLCTCGSGITACVIAFAAHLAEYQQVSVYDGSWSEWGMYGPAEA